MADDEKKVECPAGLPAWLATFADLMSLLLCFFVLLLSFSVMDAQKYRAMKGSMRNAFGVQKKIRLNQNPSSDKIFSPDFLSTPIAIKVYNKINSEIAEQLNNGQVEMEKTNDGVILRIKDSIAFEFGKADIKAKFLPVLEKIGKVINEIEAKVTVIGHSDNVPIKKGGIFSSNWSLSSARSVAVVEFWEDKFKIPSHRMSAIGSSDGQPMASNDNADGRARNRRVEFKIKLSQSALTFKGLKDILDED